MEIFIPEIQLEISNSAEGCVEMKKMIKYSPNCCDEFWNGAITDKCFFMVSLGFQTHNILCVESREEDKHSAGRDLLAALEGFESYLHCGASQSCDKLNDG